MLLYSEANAGGFFGKKKNLYFAFVDLEKAFDTDPRDTVWWVLRRLGASEWLMKIVQTMYRNAQSRED